MMTKMRRPLHVPGEATWVARTVAEFYTLVATLNPITSNYGTDRRKTIYSSDHHHGLCP